MALQLLKTIQIFSPSSSFIKLKKWASMKTPISVMILDMPIKIEMKFGIAVRIQQGFCRLFQICLEKVWIYLTPVKKIKKGKGEAYESFRFWRNAKLITIRR